MTANGVTIQVEKFRFMEDRERAFALYRALARESLAALRGQWGIGRYTFREPSPGSACFFLYDWRLGQKQGRYGQMPPYLEASWREWSGEYFRIRARSPRLEMRDLLQDVSERHFGASWLLYASEHFLEEWVCAGDFSAPMECDMYEAEYVTRPAFDRLRELREITGGWIYHDSFRLRFAAGAEWEEAKAEMRRLRARPPF